MLDTYFSPCRSYRYLLYRKVTSYDSVVTFICLNPSTADETVDDPTLRRCMGYAKDWGYGHLIMANLFAYRATDPREMKSVSDPIGPENINTLRSLESKSNLMVAAWGVNGKYLNQDEHIKNLFSESLHYLKLTKEGFPAHPLYLPKNLKPKLWVYH